MGLISVFKGILARLLFIAHGVVIVWRITSIYSSNYFYAILVPLILLPLELGITTKFTETGEWKWICPSVILYLLAAVPGLWLMQFNLYNQRIDYRDEQNLESCAAATLYNSSRLSEIQGVTIPLAFSDDQWTLILEQLLLLILILGRWLLPKGSLTRDQLSQLLLVYIGMAADILEFNLESLNDENVFCDLVLIVVVLTLWSWSLIQFTLVLTAVAGKRRRVVLQDGSTSISQECCSCCACCRNEMWAMIIGLLLQDGPFLAMRLYLMIGVRVFSIMMVFFTCKNILVILLQLYRMVILCGNSDVTPADSTEDDVEKQVVKEGASEPQPTKENNNSVAEDITS